MYDVVARNFVNDRGSVLGNTVFIVELFGDLSLKIVFLSLAYWRSVLGNKV